jgi:two-component system, NtrC family, sensor kinase
VTPSRHGEAADRGSRQAEFGARWHVVAVGAAALGPLGCIALAIALAPETASRIAISVPLTVGIASAAGLVRLMCLARARAQRAARLCIEVAAARYARAMVDNMVHGVVTTDTAGVIQWANPFASVMFGYAEAELCQQPCSVLVGEGARDAAPFAALCVGADVHGRRKDGSRFPLDVAVGTLEVGGVVRLMFVLSDATGRRQIEAQRIQANKLETMGTLVAGIAHELGTPLQYVKNQINFLAHGFNAMQDVLAKADLRRHPDLRFLRHRLPRAVEQVHFGLGQIAELVNRLGTYAHPGVACREPVQLNRIVDDAVEVTRKTWERVAGLDLHLDPALPPLAGHASGLMQVVVNLLRNAADAIAERGTGTNGRIRVATAMAGNWVRIEVADDGCGVPDAARARVFDPFFTTKAVGKGTGQGLAIVQSVAREHGGVVRFVAEPGGGSRFCVELPLQQKDEEQPKEALDAAHPVR